MGGSEKQTGNSMSPPDHPDRRTAIRAAALAALGLGGCAPPPAPPDTGGGRRFVPVQVAPERIIRTVVGLRPFRRSGFVLKAESLGAKRLVHNYGHGGGGVSLSWGTAHLAVDLAMEPAAESHAVLGCGAVGLATARLLQKRGSRVTIYARDLPPQTTSNIAGAQWQPFTVSDRAHRTPAFEEVMERASRLSQRYFQDLVGDHYGVRWIENYHCTEKPDEGYAKDPLADLYPDVALLPPGGHPFPTPHARRFLTMLIEMPVYLDALMRDFLLMGGRIVVRDFASPEELATLDEPVIMNCTGLGAKALFGDEELMPIKGQLTVLLPQPEVDYITLAGALYMFPRRDGILLGGTTERDVWSMEVNEEAQTRIVEEHRRFFEAMGAPPAQPPNR